MSERIFFNPTALNEILTEKRPSASRIATLRRKSNEPTAEAVLAVARTVLAEKLKLSTKELDGLMKQVSGQVDTLRSKESESWFSIFVATDQDTAKPRKTEKGDLIFNIKAQRPREQQLVITDDPARDGDAWRE